VVPGFNNTSADLTRIVNFIQKHHITEIHLLPYHRLGLPKYNALEKEYTLEDLDPLSVQEAQDLKQQIERDGITIKIEV
jgi:pyruvate formate lyase activating enzyme